MKFSPKMGFIFSLPRAGSTYCQRVLASSPDIVSPPEPWLLPALMGIRYSDDVVSDFAYDHVRIALQDLLTQIPSGEDAWLTAIRAMTEELYGNFVSKQSQVFIDKTPRNAGFSKEISHAFPEARFIFLWRNPLSVVSSMNNTWGNGRWKAYFYHYDLYGSLPKLIDHAIEVSADRRYLCIKYEDLVSDPQKYWPLVFDHLGVEFDLDYLVNLPKFKSVMGDKTGQEKFLSSTSESKDTWRYGFGGRLRRREAIRLLDHIGKERLRFMGYEYDELIGGIKFSGKKSISDFLYILFGPLYHRFEPRIFRENRRRWGVSRFARR